MRTLIVCLLGAAALLGPPRPGRTMALTFDDLPFVDAGGSRYLESAQRGTRQILDTARRHHAPLVGFVNEGKLDDERERDARIDLLRAWVKSGALLGNHTYSHLDLNTVTIERFEADISRGETVTRRLMSSRGPYRLYFRHPDTHTGDTERKKAAIDAFLQARGYTITPHTIENADYLFNVPYVRAQRAGNAAEAAKIADAYVEFTMAATAFAEQVAPRIFGRDIPQTLLIHANEITADCLGRLLGGFEQRGYHFIALDGAMADPAYRTRDTLVTAFGPTWLWRWTKSQGLDVSFAADPEPPAWVVDLFSARPRAPRPPAS